MLGSKGLSLHSGLYWFYSHSILNDIVRQSGRYLSLVPRRSLLIRCPREVWERPGAIFARRKGIQIPQSGKLLLVEPGIQNPWTTCKIRHHVFTTFDARIRNVLKSSKYISLFQPRQLRILKHFYFYILHFLYVHRMCWRLDVLFCK